MLTRLAGVYISMQTRQILASLVRAYMYGAMTSAECKYLKICKLEVGFGNARGRSYLLASKYDVGLYASQLMRIAYSFRIPYLRNRLRKGLCIFVT